MTTTTAAAGPRPRTRRAGTVAGMVLRAALALVFAGAGAAKVAGDAAMVELFADIGSGQWLRYLVGALELAAAAGLLVPRLIRPAAAGLVLLMVGATGTNLFVLHVSPVLTLALLIAAAVVAGTRRPQGRASARSASSVHR